jgi:hypothetical protein
VRRVLLTYLRERWHAPSGASGIEPRPLARLIKRTGNAHRSEFGSNFLDRVSKWEDSGTLSATGEQGIHNNGCCQDQANRSNSQMAIAKRGSLPLLTDIGWVSGNKR